MTEPKLYEEFPATHPSLASNAASENDAGSLLFECIYEAITDWAGQALHYSGRYPFTHASSISLAETIQHRILDDGVYLNVATHNTKPLTDLQIRSAVYGCSDGKCLCGRCEK